MQYSTDLTKEILSLEKKYWSAMQEHDLESALELTDFPCIVAGSHGMQNVNKEKFIEMFNSQADNSIRAFIFDEDKAEVRQLGPDTAVVAYNVQSTFQKNGEDKTISAVDTSTWVRKNDKWVCAMHTETELVKPVAKE